MQVTPPHEDFALAHAVAAAALAIPAIALTRRVAVARGWMATPRDDRWHREPVALHGGLGVLTALLVGSILVPTLPGAIDLSLHRAVLPAMALLAAVGLIDDLHHLRPWQKFAWQALAAGVLGWMLAGAAGLSHADAAIIAGWALVFCNSVNMLDNMDGACATAAIPCFIGIALVTKDTRTASLAGSAAGAMAGFWWWNKPSARIFLGDSGALPIGLLFGALAALVGIESVQGDAGAPAPAEPLIGHALALAAMPALLGLPFVIDTGFVCVTRALRGQNPMIGGTDHLTHRALRAGWSPWAVLAVVGALGVLGAAAAFVLARWVG